MEQVQADESVDEPRFLLIARREEGVEYSRGCRIGSSPSAFVESNWLNRKGLVEQWSELVSKNMQRESSEEEYEFYVYRHGVKVFDKSTFHWDGHYRYGYDTPQYLEHENECDVQEAKDREEITAIYLEVLREATLLVGKARTAAQLEKEREAEREVKKAREDRLALFKKLYAEFGGDGDASTPGRPARDSTQP